ncbi:MAG: type VI secretion system tube protein Hcp [bacterium]|nr:type VI secretion system tube protein Hcp [bacterium]
MVKKNLFFVLGALALVAVLGITTSLPQRVVAAAADYYLKIEGIKGSAGGDAIAIESWSFGASNPISVGSGSAGLSGGKVSISSFNFMKRVDKSSPQLFQASQTGAPIKSLTLSSKVGKENVVLNFKDVVVSSYGLNSSGSKTTESLSFTYAKVEVTWPKSAQ